jgi:hypothetical protein
MANDLLFSMEQCLCASSHGNILDPDLVIKVSLIMVLVDRSIFHSPDLRFFTASSWSVFCANYNCTSHMILGMPENQSGDIWFGQRRPITRHQDARSRSAVRGLDVFLSFSSASDLPTPPAKHNRATSIVFYHISIFIAYINTKLSSCTEQ